MKRKSAFLPCAIIAFLALTFKANAEIKSVATVTGLDKYVNVTLPAPYNETASAGTFKATIDGKSTSLYCIDISHPLAMNEPYNDVMQTDDILSYILNNYYPYKTGYQGALSPVEKEACAVQLAIWSFTDNLDINKVTNVDSNIKTRALAIAGDASLNAHSFNLNTFAINIPPQSFETGSAITFTVQAFNEKGLAMPDVQITLSSSAGVLSGSTAVTGVNGVTPVITLTPSANLTSATITATGVVGIPSGTKFYHTANPNGKQKIILAKPTTASRTITKSVNWSAPIALNVNKIADKTTINNGDIVSYTIKVTNTSQTAAQNVQVSDQLQSCLQLISTNQEGDFNSSTGIWSVGSLSGGESKSIVIKVKANLGGNAPAFDLGIAKNYNMFIVDTLIQPSSDTEGKLAVGSYAELSNYSVGDKLSEHSGDVLVVGGHLHFLHGRVYNGSAVYGNFITSTTAFSADDSIYQNPSAIDFNAAKIYLEDLSNQLSLITENGTQTLEYGELALTGTNTDLNIFKVDGSKLAGINNFTINVPSNSAVLVNIYGDVTSWSGGFTVTGTSKENVLLNFYNSSNIKISNIEIQASILAPGTRINFPSGLVSGQVIAKCLFGQVQVNNFAFGGKIQSSSSVANVATIVNAVQANMTIPMNFPPANVVNSVGGVNGIKSSGSKTPREFMLGQNYPNPFNPSTSITFSVAKKEFVSLAIYDITGRIVKTLVNQELESGEYTTRFNAAELSSGIYIYRFASNSFTASRKMLLLK
jgi:choice-of-anchor A domain-containing protein/uncharacterized repeat protein (TIGR01451 family)